MRLNYQLIEERIKQIFALSVLSKAVQAIENFEKLDTAPIQLKPQDLHALKELNFYSSN